MEYIQLIITIIIILGIFYISDYIKKKKDTEIKEMQNAIKQGDKIITYTGLSGIVDKVLDDRIILKVYPNMTDVSIEKWAIAGLDDRNISMENLENNNSKKTEKSNN